MGRHVRTGALALLGLLSLGATGAAQRLEGGVDLGASHLVVPQSRGWSFRRGDAAIEIERVDATVRILQATARTTLDVMIRNPGANRAEAVILLPVPDGAVVHSFAFQGAAAEPVAEVLPADRARRTYDGIVRRLRDPALLEFAGYQLVRTSVFPVEAHGSQRVRLSYDHVLETDGPRVDYVLPRSENVRSRTPWRIAVDLQSEAPVSMVYSPSHDLRTARQDARHLLLSVTEETCRDPGPFRLSYLAERSGVSASLFAYPDAAMGGGYFLLMAGLPAQGPQAPKILREVSLVLDRSGSMAGGKLDQAKAAVLQVVEGLDDGERFNLIDYSTTVEKFSAASVVKGPETVAQLRVYLQRLKPGGGTNIHDALTEALLQPDPGRGMLPLVLFLTDGLPTVGKTSEVKIGELVEEGNAQRRRIFTFGVGHDVNVPLLDRISDRTRALSTFVRPEEDVELAVAKVFRRLQGPVLADAALRVLGENGEVDTRRVRECIPSILPDVYDGESMIVLGQYHGAAPLRFQLAGELHGQSKVYEFEFDLDRATTRNAFVARLWAGRRINELADEVRQLGAQLTPHGLAAGAPIPDDPRFHELTEEILRLSAEFGVLSEYTSFLAREGTDLGDWNNLLIGCAFDLNVQALGNRSGTNAVQQGLNFNDRKVQTKLNYRNGMWSDRLQKVEVTEVQQVCDRAFFKRGPRWVDSRAFNQVDEALEVHEEVEFGSERHATMVQDLLRQGRVGCLSLEGEILLRYEDRNVLVKNGAPAEQGGD